MNYDKRYTPYHGTRLPRRLRSVGDEGLRRMRKGNCEVPMYVRTFACTHTCISNRTLEQRWAGDIQHRQTAG